MSRMESMIKFVDVYFVSENEYGVEFNLFEEGY